jgi:hopene-associated glycosyltransferase HpnB
MVNGHGMLAQILAAIGCAIWLYLLLGRGGFWLARERDRGELPRPPAWPKVAIVVPARDEAEGIGASLASLLRQDYPGEWQIVLVDDSSSDGTAAIAARTAAEHASTARLTIIPGRPLPGGWTGKVWAQSQGIEAAQGRGPDYLLLTDADIIYAPEMLTRLVARAERDRLALASLMVLLRCESLAERALVPAFVFFFQMLYPFGWIKEERRRVAGAAGGSMLVRAQALARAGGIGLIRNALIDDCALAAILKTQGPIWLGLTERVHSIRRYGAFGDIRRMVARSAYAQLHYSPLLLAGTIAGMGLTYLAPPLLALFASGLARALGLAAWLAMAVAFQPTLRLYRVSPLWGIALPAIAFCYTVFTLDSALQYARGKGGMWKGRVQAG